MNKKAQFGDIGMISKIVAGLGIVLAVIATLNNMQWLLYTGIVLIVVGGVMYKFIDSVKRY